MQTYTTIFNSILLIFICLCGFNGRLINRLLISRLILSIGVNRECDAGSIIKCYFYSYKSEFVIGYVGDFVNTTGTSEVVGIGFNLNGFDIVKSVGIIIIGGFAHHFSLNARITHRIGIAYR